MRRLVISSELTSPTPFGLSLSKACPSSAP